MSFDIEIPYGNYVYRHRVANVLGLGGSLFGNVGHFSFGVNSTSSEQIKGENDRKAWGEEISNMKAYKISVETYFIPIRGTIIQPKLGLAGGMTWLSFSYNRFEEDKPNSVEKISGGESYLSAIGRLDVYIAIGYSLYVKGEYRLLNKSNGLPDNLNNNYTISIGFSGTI